MGDGLVECHSGSEYAERPTALHWQGQRLEIDGIQAQWRIPDGKCFLVSVAGGNFFELVYVEENSEWIIHSK